MSQMIAKPNLLKQVNLSQVRIVLGAKENVTRSEIVKETGISTTTVRALLGEMMENGEVCEIGYDESSGGRKAKRYAMCPDCYLGAAFCCKNDQLHALLVNLRGNILEKTKLIVRDGKYEEAIIVFLDELVKKRKINAIGIGVPGITDGHTYWKKLDGSDELCRMDLGSHLFSRYDAEVILENDMNAITIGFGRCYDKMFPGESRKKSNMVCLNFEPGCVSAGILADGHIVRGCNCFAGEMGLIPIQDDKLLDSLMYEDMSDEEYIRWMVHILGFLCGILNPQYIALGGACLREKCIASINDVLFSLLPGKMSAELLYAPNLWNDYHEGMACLTAGRILEVVSLVKE